jgi:hypothetical protein
MNKILFHKEIKGNNSIGYGRLREITREFETEKEKKEQQESQSG